MEHSQSNKSKIGGNPYDMNGQHFNPDMYLQKLFKVCYQLHLDDFIRSFFFLPDNLCSSSLSIILYILLLVSYLGKHFDS